MEKGLVEKQPIIIAPIKKTKIVPKEQSSFQIDATGNFAINPVKKVESAFSLPQNNDSDPKPITKKKPTWYGDYPTDDQIIAINRLARRLGIEPSKVANKMEARTYLYELNGHLRRQNAERKEQRARLKASKSTR
jgi:hypothetical protein